MIDDIFIIRVKTTWEDFYEGSLVTEEQIHLGDNEYISVLAPAVNTCLWFTSYNDAADKVNAWWTSIGEKDHCNFLEIVKFKSSLFATVKKPESPVKEKTSFVTKEEQMPLTY